MGGVQEWRVREPTYASVASYPMSSEHSRSLVCEDILLLFLLLLLVIISTVQESPQKSELCIQTAYVQIPTSSDIYLFCFYIKVHVLQLACTTQSLPSSQLVMSCW